MPREWAQMDAQQLRDLTATVFERVQQQETQLTEQQAQLIRRAEELKRRQLKIDRKRLGNTPLAGLPFLCSAGLHRNPPGGASAGPPGPTPIIGTIVPALTYNFKF